MRLPRPSVFLVPAALVLFTFAPLAAAQPSLESWKRLQCGGAAVTGRYLNLAEGFSVAVPSDMDGRRGQAAGPERGVSILLAPACESVVVVYGEANSLEARTAKDALDWTVNWARDRDRQAEVSRYSTTLGPLRAAGVTIRSSSTSDVEDIVVALRPRGGLVYTAHLATTAARYPADRKRFAEIVRSFRLETWK